MNSIRMAACGSRKIEDNTLERELQSTSSRISVFGALLHSDSNRTLQEGIMVLGLLYRSILDELTGASKTIRLCIHLDHHLGNHVPDFNVFSVQVRPRI